MKTDYTIRSMDEDFEAQPVCGRIFITATALVPQQEFPTHVLEKLPPQILAKMAEVKAAGGVLHPEDPDDSLAPEVYVSLIRHADMVIEEVDEVVIPAARATLRLRYPLSCLVLVPVNAGTERGITRGNVLHAIHDAYAGIYRREESVSRPVPIDDRGTTLNRDSTEGPFGIWGHDITDLRVEWIDLRQVDGAWFIDPVIGS
ncbi:hypothetical protein LAZ40_02110 [Cereibacter sphaeroides]|uniref:hypothetical protein n=1 Tax=Cereibacter sphaeroides TaxID=1063 RepID=UPI001F31CDD4|nr:hypothetical protein [Cereibacter sphaeroides]MCE6957851.1 hypothetical protein [Cereibacter sphaeroides]MCE6971820.1 hypothetical protein [Cereibacter sphaeroides]